LGIAGTTGSVVVGAGVGVDVVGSWKSIVESEGDGTVVSTLEEEGSDSSGTLPDSDGEGSSSYEGMVDELDALDDDDEPLDDDDDEPLDDDIITTAAIMATTMHTARPIRSFRTSGDMVLYLFFLKEADPTIFLGPPKNAWLLFCCCTDFFKQKNKIR
jgi:hypothetical protein